MVRSLIIIVCVFFCSGQLYSQAFVYSKNYFRWPLAIRPAIVANFGELRSNHWHMGLDIRTEQKENIPVYAAAGGYISRISVSPFGYGRAIYIIHPNGLTTVYGHLNKFFPRLDSFVTAQQYKQQSWEIELEFTRDKFPVQKGQFIAYSGSTGASEGPHVHFEIRDTKTNRCLNPLFFDLPIPDAVPPVFTKLALYDRNLSVYGKDPRLFPVKKIRNGFMLSEKLIKIGFSKIGFAIGAYDCVSGSTSANGIYSARIFFDGKLFNSFALDSIDYNETGYVNAHIDYRYRYHSGSYLQQLFKLPGDKGRAYQTMGKDGTISLTDTGMHLVKIEIEDVKHNTSLLNFKVQFDNSLASRMNYPSNKSFVPNYLNIFEQDDFELYLGENCLYDSIQPVFYRINKPEPNAVSQIFQFCDASVPVHGQINIHIRPNVDIPGEWKNNIIIKRTDGRTTSYHKAEWQKGWLVANFSDFGAYQAFIDNIPPSINEPGQNDTIDLSAEKKIVFYPRDNTGIKNFRAELDNQWLMFSNDKGLAWIYNFDKRCPYGVHQLKIRIEDIAGNVTEKKWWFKRYPYTPPKKKKTGGKRKITSRKKATRKG